VQDYYAFGMQMPGRKLSGGYRYGFNGKENDNEVKGEGNQQDYGMRIYDPRLGRFLSIDPLTPKYPWYTPYQFGSNSPISNIDLDGLEGLIATGMPNPFSKNDRPVGMIITAKDAFEINKRLIVATFKAAFTENLPKKFIEHYAYGDGKPYTLNKSEVIELKSAPTGLRGIADVDKEKFQKLISNAKPGNIISLPDGYSIEGGASTGGTLGRFTISLTGKITFDNKDASKWTFEGTMQFNDTWDFKTSPVSPKELQRSAWGDLQTKLGGKYLPGEGFQVSSEIMKVKQNSSDATFDWYKGKSADGKQNEISNDMRNHPNEANSAIKSGNKEN
jgi:RHS repeat-associated protein